MMNKLIPIAGVAALAASAAAFAEPGTAPAKADAAKVQTVRMPNGRVARLSSDNRVRPASTCASAAAKKDAVCLPMGEANKMAVLAKKSGTD